MILEKEQIITISIVCLKRSFIGIQNRKCDKFIEIKTVRMYI